MMADQELRAGGGSPALHDSAIVSQSPSAHGVAGPVSHTQWITGCAIRVTTLSGEVVEGEVYAVDEASTESLILRLPNTTRATLPSVFDYRIIATRFIKNAVYISGAQGAPIAEPSYVCVDEMKRRKAKAVFKAKEAIAQIGVGVTPEAQNVFDSLAKTMGCRWDGQSIVVLDMVTIRSPYGEGDCELDTSLGNDGALTQVKLLLRECHRRESGPVA
eukprot:m.226369 g.226369  ORF g.226369 m.226369 type:complete len:217 (-) comp25928_c2_seq1:1653-2303(-)